MNAIDPKINDFHVLPLVWRKKCMETEFFLGDGAQ